MLFEIRGEFSTVNCSRISEPSGLNKSIPAFAVAIHFLFPPSTSISVICVLPNTYSTFPSKETLTRCASYSPGEAPNAFEALYRIAKPASVPIHISPSKSAAIAVTLSEGKFPEFDPEDNCTY